MEYILLDPPHQIHAAVAAIASLKHVWDIRQDEPECQWKMVKHHNKD